MKKRNRRLVRRGTRHSTRRRLRAAAIAAAVLAGLVLANWVYQVARKPSELLFPVSGMLFKTPDATWREYGGLFRAHATAVMAPEFLAALAQVEGGGNPLAQTYWRWSFSWNPFEVYRPASSAVGMLQITDARFEEASRYCIHGHEAAEEGAWHEWRSCWFNALYNRLVPSHAIEMTAAFLDRRAAAVLARGGIAGAGLREKQALAAVIHLCGAARAEAFARRRFRAAPGERCGEHLLAAYLAQLDAARREFARLSSL